MKKPVELFAPGTEVILEIAGVPITAVVEAAYTDQNGVSYRVQWVALGDEGAFVHDAWVNPRQLSRLNPSADVAEGGSTDAA